MGKVQPKAVVVNKAQIYIYKYIESNMYNIL